MNNHFMLTVKGDTKESAFPIGCFQTLCFYQELHYLAEKAMAPHSSTLAWKIPRMEEPGELQSMAPWRVGHDWATHFHFSLSCIGEGNGNPLQCSCLENPRDGEAWWAAVYGVAQSRAWLKRLSSSSSSILSWPKIFSELGQGDLCLCTLCFDLKALTNSKKIFRKILKMGNWWLGLHWHEDQVS